MPGEDSLGSSRSRTEVLQVWLPTQFLPTAQRLGLIEVLVVRGTFFLNFQWDMVEFRKTFTKLVVVG